MKTAGSNAFSQNNSACVKRAHKIWSFLILIVSLPPPKRGPSCPRHFILRVQVHGSVQHHPVPECLAAVLGKSTAGTQTYPKYCVSVILPDVRGLKYDDLQAV